MTTIHQQAIIFVLFEKLSVPPLLLTFLIMEMSPFSVKIHGAYNTVWHIIEPE